MRLEPGNPSPPTLELMPTLSLEPPGMPEHTKSSPWGKSLWPVLPHPRRGPARLSVYLAL